MQRKLGEQPLPAVRPSWWDMNALGYFVFYGIPSLVTIAALCGWKPGWWIAGILWLITFTAYSIVRNDCQ